MELSSPRTANTTPRPPRPRMPTLRVRRCRWARPRARPRLVLGLTADGGPLLAHADQTPVLTTSAARTAWVLRLDVVTSYSFMSLRHDVGRTLLQTDQIRTAQRCCLESVTVQVTRHRGIDAERLEREGTSAIAWLLKRAKGGFRLEGTCRAWLARALAGSSGQGLPTGTEDKTVGVPVERLDRITALFAA